MSEPRTIRLAVWPGDGIGLEVTPPAIDAIRAAVAPDGVNLELQEFDWGHRHWQRTGQTVPADFLTILQSFDAIFLGALGDPANLADHVTLRPLIEMRQRFDQYACLRPATLLPGVATPLAGKEPGDIDILVVRENSEGEYVTAGGAFHPHDDDELVVQTAFHSRRGIERILRFAFERARARRRRLTMATKSNALAWSMVLWDRLLDKLHPEYPDVTADKLHIDAFCMNFVRCPEHYDVVVASNLFGDILSDLGGAIVGSLGLAPSANLNPERLHPSLFEPVHGSAPDIAGRGVANPIAAIRSAAMLLDFLDCPAAASRIEAAVRRTLADGKVRTPDLGGSHTTTDLADDILAHLA